MSSSKRLCFCGGVLLLAIGIELGLFPSVAAHGGGSREDAADSAPSDSNSAPDHPNLRATGLILVKIWCLIIAFVATFVAGISPYYFRWNATFLVLGTQFAGGVFLATALLHFLSDANESFKLHTDKTYPFAFMLATFGYLFTMLGDCIISLIFSKSAGNIEKLQSFKADPESGKRGAEETHPQTAANSFVVPTSSEETGPIPCNCEPTDEPKNMIAATIASQTSWGDALLLILALCFHSVFEGIAIGVAETKYDAWRNLWTVCLHKLFAAVGMGIALLRILPNRPLLSCAFYSFAFAISTPIGIGIGIAIDSTTQGAVADWVYAISMGIACGVFIYVAINHLLGKALVPQNKVKYDTPFMRLLVVTLGAGVIAVVMIWD